jgi:uncharacterized Zn-finger protein
MRSPTGKPLPQDQAEAENQRWYMDHPEVILVTSKKVACDGGGGALGHPKVWYDMFEDDKVECKYCDRVFVLKGGSYDKPG